MSLVFQRSALTAFAAAILLAGAGAASAQVVPRIEVYPDRAVSFPDGVIGLADVTYSSIDGYRPLTLDLYVPKGEHKPRPLVIYVHGGGWSGGTKRLAGTFADWPATLAGIAARGYVVASVSYRFSGEARFPAAIQDVKSAIRWLRANSAKYDIDPNRVLIWGGSAGGQLAGLAATSCGAAALEPPPQNPAVVPNPGGSEVSDCVQAAILFYPVTDFARLMPPAPVAPPKAIGQFLGCASTGCSPETLATASPITYVSPKSPPFLIVHGSADHTVPTSQSQVFYDSLKTKGVRAELMIVPGVDHSFVGANPAANAAVNAEVLARVNAFIDSTVGPGAK